MKKVITLGMVFLLVIMSFTSISGIQIDKNIIIPSDRGNILYVGGSGEGNYSKIQDAINDATKGDTIFVFNGTYYENIIIQKTIFLIGENKYNTTIDGTQYLSVICILGNNVTIKGFTIQNSSWNDYRYAGIEIYSIKNNIEGNIIKNNNVGIHPLYAGQLNKGGSNTFKDNILIGNGMDAFCIHSSYNNILHNHIENNHGGIWVHINAIGNKIEKNNFINNDYNAAFFKSYFTQWNNNYWDDWIGLRIPFLNFFPYVIVKNIIFNDDFVKVPWFNFDWHPASEPYNYTSTQGCGIE